MNRLSLTYLGWQGWLISSSSTVVLFDGLLVEQVGRGPEAARLGFVFPDVRDFAWDALPEIDACVISHEHEDHFNIPTLARLDRSIPVYISDRVSPAARTILEEMGFIVTYLAPGVTRTIGDLEVTPYSPDPTSERLDEWDTLAFGMRLDNVGSFFTPVDVEPPARMRDAMRAQLTDAPRELLLYFGSMGISVGPPEDVSVAVANAHAPSSGGGHRFQGDPDGARRALEAGGIVRPHAGMTFELRAERALGVADRAPFLRSAGKRQGRSFSKADGDEIAAPLVGSPDLTTEETSEIVPYLEEMAAFLYGRTLYQKLLSVDVSLLGDVRPTFALVLLTGEDQEDLIFEYVPPACSFRRVQCSVEEIERAYVGTVLMWGRDLLTLARGEIEPRTLGHNIDEVWMLGSTSLWKELWIMYHPHRFPDRVLAQYRRIAKEERGLPVRAAPTR